LTKRCIFVLMAYAVLYNIIINLCRIVAVSYYIPAHESVCMLLGYFSVKLDIYSYLQSIVIRWMKAA